MLKRLLICIVSIVALCPIVWAQEAPAIGFSVALDTHGRLKPVQTTKFGSMDNFLGKGISIDLVTVVAIERNVPLGFGAMYSRRIADNAYWTIGLFGAATAGSIQGGVLTGFTIGLN